MRIAGRLRVGIVSRVVFGEAALHFVEVHDLQQQVVQPADLDVRQVVSCDEMHGTRPNRTQPTDPAPDTAAPADRRASGATQQYFNPFCFFCQTVKKLHDQSHRQERGKKFIKEKIALLERLMSEKGYNYLILAGDARRTAEIQRALPKALNEKVCDVVNLPAKAGHDNIVAATLQSPPAFGDRRPHRMAPANVREALREAEAVPQRAVLPEG